MAPVTSQNPGLAAAGSAPFSRRRTFLLPHSEHTRSVGRAAHTLRYPTSESTASAADITAGGKLYATYCVRCHGGATVLPDLRRSSPSVLNGLEKILDGAMVERGMPRFAEFDKAIPSRRACSR